MMVTWSSAILFACFIAQSTVASAQEAPPAADRVRVGDMLLFSESVSSPSSADAIARAADGFTHYYTGPWPGGTVPVVFNESVSADRRRLFLDACAAWTPGLGLRCVERTNEFRWLDVTAAGAGCVATVGAPTHDNGHVELGDPACWTPGTLVHELGHVFGLIHEHQRPDRDRYVEIHAENIQPDFRRSFEVLFAGRPLGEYDFDSVMHFSPSTYGIDGRRTMEPRPAYAERGRRMGQASRPSPRDVEALAQFYRASPRSPSDRRPAIAFTREDFVAATDQLHKIYVMELQRDRGLFVDGRIDLVGVAAWIFDVYLNSRASGYTEGESLYNMRAGISHTDEWRSRHPHLAPLPMLPTFSPLTLDRGEYLQAMYRLDEAYRTELLRPDGLSIDGGPDFIGLATWIFDVYLNAKLAGRSPDEAWAIVLAAIRTSDEYRQKHPA